MENIQRLRKQMSSLINAHADAVVRDDFAEATRIDGLIEANSRRQRAEVN